MQKINFETGMKYVRATLGFEGLVLTAEEEKLLERRFHGEITEEEYIRKALELSYL
ncbi:antitoxin VbhA family protein [Bacillus velezensis]|uniref:antitoxin VbhA family protein n=1 Tax=Bacillus velezensis TaxID=492670 RepID=UPI0026F094DD|nr:antitoxin VbhA family protein [Bacillus velezensis]